MRRKGKLLFLCGKMAAGKSTLSKELARREDAVLLAQDEFIERLFPGEIVGLQAHDSGPHRNRLPPRDSTSLVALHQHRG